MQNIGIASDGLAWCSSTPCTPRATCSEIHDDHVKIFLLARNLFLQRGIFFLMLKNKKSEKKKKILHLTRKLKPSGKPLMIKPCPFFIPLLSFRALLWEIITQHACQYSCSTPQFSIGNMHRNWQGIHTGKKRLGSQSSKSKPKPTHLKQSSQYNTNNLHNTNF